MLHTGTNVSIEVKPKLAVGVEAVAVFVTEGSRDAGEAASALLADDERMAVERLLRAGVSRGKAREVHFDLIDSPGRAGKPQTTDYRRVLVVGLGPAKKVTNETVRQAAGALARAAKKLRLKDVAVVVPPLGTSPSSGQNEATDDDDGDDSPAAAPVPHGAGAGPAAAAE